MHPGRTALRIASGADAPAIAEVHVEGWRWGYRELMPDALLDFVDSGDRTERWQRTLDDPSTTVWVAEREGAVVGFLAGGAAREDDDRADGWFEVYALYQRERVARTGVARALLDHALMAARARGVRGVFLWVLSTNAAARGFYEVAGLTADGATKVERLAAVDLPHARYSLAFR